MIEMDAATKADRNVARMIPQHTRTVIRREMRAAASDTAEVKRIVSRWARKYGVSESAIRCINRPELWDRHVE